MLSGDDPVNSVEEFCQALLGLILKDTHLILGAFLYFSVVVFAKSAGQRE